MVARHSDASLRTGGPERDRTADLLNANQALSQLSYRPKRVNIGSRGSRTSKSKRGSGGPNRNCTCDPRVISTVLYSLSYRPVTESKKRMSANFGFSVLTPRFAGTTEAAKEEGLELLHSTHSYSHCQ